jgi:hypothetical protein
MNINKGLTMNDTELRLRCLEMATQCPLAEQKHMAQLLAEQKHMAQLLAEQKHMAQLYYDFATASAKPATAVTLAAGCSFRS